MAEDYSITIVLKKSSKQITHVRVDNFGDNSVILQSIFVSYRHSEAHVLHVSVFSKLSNQNILLR